jgi:hypothetical protein
LHSSWRDERFSTLEHFIDMVALWASCLAPVPRFLPRTWVRKEKPPYIAFAPAHDNIPNSIVWMPVIVWIWVCRGPHIGSLIAKVALVEDNGTFRRQGLVWVVLRLWPRGGLWDPSPFSDSCFLANEVNCVPCQYYVVPHPPEKDPKPQVHPILYWSLWHCEINQLFFSCKLNNYHRYFTTVIGTWLIQCPQERGCRHVCCGSFLYQYLCFSKGCPILVHN